MSVATLTSKGQITIPKSVRDALRLQAGVKLEFILSSNGDVLIRPMTKKVEDVYGMLRKHGRTPVSVEEMDSAIRWRTMAKFG